MKVYTIDIYYGEMLIGTIEIEAASEFHALLKAKDECWCCLKGVARK